MASHLIKTLKPTLPTTTAALRRKTTSSEYVASRARDPTFEKLMEKYKNLLKVISIQDLILSNPTSPSLSLLFLDRLSQRLRLNRGAAPFLRRYPHIFHIFSLDTQPHCKLTPAAAQIAAAESASTDPATAGDRLRRLLSMSLTRTLPLRAILKVWRELGLPDDFEDSVISKNPNLFELIDDPREPNTHLIKLISENNPSFRFTSAVENWRVMECCKNDSKIDRTEIGFSFKLGFPPGMRLSKNFRAKVKEWQMVPYVGPYEEERESGKSKVGKMRREKQAVAIVHEFLSLTVEKMVEVEKISQFRKWFGIDLNIRDLFLDHPGIFYLSTKGKMHTVFLREAYERGCLIEPNPVYVARRKLLDLVLLERRGLFNGDLKSTSVGGGEMEQDSEDDDNE